MRRIAVLAALALLGLAPVPRAGADPEPAPAVPRPGDVTVFRTDQAVTAFVDATQASDGAWWGLQEGGLLVRIDADGAETVVTAFPPTAGDPYRLVAGPGGSVTALAIGAMLTITTATLQGDVTSRVVDVDITDAAVGPDGTVWILDGETVTRVDADGTTLAPVALPSEGYSLAVDPDGTGWIALGDAGMALVTPGGDTTTIDLGEAAPELIALRPDGTAVISSFPSGLATVDAEGSVDEIEGSDPVDRLTVGVNGDVWGQAGGDVLHVGDVLSQHPVPLVDPSPWAPTAIAVGPDGRLWLGEQGWLHAVSPEGAIEIVPLGHRAPSAVTSGVDGTAWFVGADERVSRTTASGRVASFPVPGPPGRSIVTGADGALWISGPSLRRVADDGTVTGIDLPVIGDDLAASPDGDLWVTRGSWGPSSPELLRVTPAGEITEVPVDLPPGGHVSEVEVGSDGTAWVLHATAAGQDPALTRIPPTGPTTTITLAGIAGGHDLAVDADGTVWVAGTSVARVVGDVVTTYPTGDFFAAAVTAGPDGNVWLAGAENDILTIGRLTPDGDLTRYPGTDTGLPRQIAATPDGFVWVPGATWGAHDGHHVARVAVGVVDVAVEVTPDAVPVGTEFQAQVTVTNVGPTSLTDVALSSDLLDGCAGELDDLAPGTHQALTCSTMLLAEGTIQVDATVTTAETQPVTAADTVEATAPSPTTTEPPSTTEPPTTTVPEEPVATCLGEDVTVDLAAGDQPTDGDDVILGTPGPDTIHALAGRDLVCGFGGDDTVHGGAGDDTTSGGVGRDRLTGGPGADQVAGEDGSDVVSGGGGHDHLLGGIGPDTLDGGPGDDRLVAGPGDDTCRGGPGTDTGPGCRRRYGIP